MSLTIKNVENLQKQLQNDRNDYQIELQQGEIKIMGPSDIVSSFVGAQFSRLLGNWVFPRRLGFIFDSSGGFILPNTDLTAPDVSFVSRSRMPRTVRYFGQIVPDLVVEIKSQSDRISKLRKKIRMYLQQGATVGVLIDPDELTVSVYRLNEKPVIYRNDEILNIPELFPGWEIAITELWPPVFDESEEIEPENV
ncbi:Uma2 family endonuclease [Ancylothrix sp. C2]|uniref:Uma2 family endonuclease n=1 Tax=Ancylothrix sp. D3o TaxID=2953691 RepID=UPI0021BB4CB6|nr:Uma2 family endonuclease [Ancylothrix sp. D3o]MCT7950348.1 Uma2 family endonuclease [Ancylothrix sp. D3o]